MTIKQLYKLDFDSAITHFMETQNNITTLDTLKAFMQERLDEDYFTLLHIWRKHSMKVLPPFTIYMTILVELLLRPIH